MLAAAPATKVDINEAPLTPVTDFSFIPVADPVLGSDEKEALCEVIDSGWITMGERVQRFEEDLAKIHAVDETIAVNSCTAGLHLILHALGIGPGDEVLVPSLTFVATINCVLYVGAKPVLVDIESLDNPLMSLEEAESKCTERTRAIILVHYAGYLADLPAWKEFADRRGLLLIEDAAHATGLKEVGTYSVAAALSFYGNKNMTTAEGGAIIASDPDLRDRMRKMRGHGLTSGTFQRHNGSGPGYDMIMLGFNFRMDELRAAIGIVQLKNLEAWNLKRRQLTNLYRALLEEYVPEVVVPFDENTTSSYHIMPVILPGDVDRSRVIKSLRDAGIQTTIHYPPAHLFSYYRERLPSVKLPKTEEYSERELTLPLFPRLNDAHVERVTQALAKSVHCE
ncbi:DegT/DnrJ/EryC1/StrS family aminotransferase [Microvirga lotononidis]|uniref:Putative PLP-dependent enzyme possibly involved in cell wall biogenesis n=1 Tax=Microvirga lotononidis TaxID=864069 RepID=I4YYA3_9HYPH|nr:DegT/DnrJ/EryC1/StrS family aminotransferase [Microvirga lotononidis]EIM28945.1 putative PLP-dependent enzyme possibly involved in cell wall biogenesis [Microvirga lotononidis]WQO26863.1 DegT/DnrJ/EryC1/StrS family aminotransferase [Microvirga lotononidis]